MDLTDKIAVSRDAIQVLHLPAPLLFRSLFFFLDEQNTTDLRPKELANDLPHTSRRAASPQVSGLFYLIHLL